VRRVAPSASTEQMLEALAPLARMPREGCAPEVVLEELVQLATPGLTAMSGPRFFGWVTGGTLPAAIAADWMTAAWDQNAGPAAGAPAAAAFELTALGWIKELLDLPATARGALVTGATLANFTALAAARTHVLEACNWDVDQDGLFGAPPVRVLVGQERHDTIDKALRLLGFGKRALTCLPTDSQGRMSSAALQKELGRTTGPVIVCAQAGNVNSGAFDPLPEIHRLLSVHREAHGADASWLHLDGAFGLWARAAAEVAPLAQGAELADSWATDAHKFLNVPYDCGVVLTRHPKAHRRALAVQGAYLSSGAHGKTPNPGAYAPELSRRARGFALWAALRQLGGEGVSALVTRTVSLAQRLARELTQTPGLEVQNDVVFNQVVVSADGGAADARAFTRDFALAIQREGTCYATPTLWRGAPGLRFSVINAATTEDDIVRSARAVSAVYRSLRAAADRG
jgi:glutamate/tyrosine decarboxylase-like PLP-dependent enzyme